MAIRRKQTQIPTEGFPPVRLYLDDIQEIIEIFRESIKYKSWEKNTDSERLVFECDDKTCETIEDLQTIGGKTRNFQINFSLQGASHELTIHTLLVFWRFYGLTTEGGWDTHRKLTTVFNTRCVKWKAAFRSLPVWAPAFLASPLSFILVFILKRVMPKNLAEALPLGLMLLFLVVWGIAYFRPTVVFLRPSSESSGLREPIKRSAPQVIAGLIGVGATLLGVYLKHKIWP